MNAFTRTLEAEKRALAQTTPGNNFDTLTTSMIQCDHIPRVFDGPKVSIHTPIYSRPGIGYDFVTMIMGCVALQIYQNYEHVLIDDSSGDFNPSQAADRLSRVGIGYDLSKLRLIRSGSALVCDKRNLALSEVQGEIIANFDDDDYRYPEYLLKAVRWIAATERGNFLNGQSIYGLHEKTYRKKMLYRCGSGHWVYWRKWQQKYGITYSRWNQSEARSDENFLRMAERDDPGFTRHESCPALDGLGLRIRHGLNVSWLKWPTRSPDPDMSVLRHSVDPRLYEILREISAKL